MGRTFIAKHNGTGGLGLALTLPLHQHLHAARQQGDLAFLAGDHVAEIIHSAGEVGELFFNLLHAGGFSSVERA